MKRLILILIPSILLALLIFLSFQYIAKYRVEKGALQVTADPQSKVYLNDNYLGITPLCKCDTGEMLDTGEYSIRLVPSDKTFHEFQEKITIEKSIQTVVDWKFGKDSLSEGSVISLSPLDDKKKMQLEVVSFPQDATVWLDNNSIGKTPLLFNDPTESDHVIKVRKDGYREKTLRLHTPAGYKLSVSVYLATSTDVSAAPTTASPSASPSPSAAVVKVTIEDTPTGFLRVRADSSLDADEIGQVHPGESYQLLDELPDWYKIKLNDGRAGWISSEYATKSQ